MPIPASSLEAEEFLRALIIGQPKYGKTQTVISTAPGPVYVIECDEPAALKGALIASPKNHFEYDPVTGWDSMERARKFARDGVVSGKYKTVVLDGLSSFGARIKEQAFASTLTKSGEQDGRRAWPLYSDRIMHVIRGLLSLKAHVIVLSHYMHADDANDGVDDGKGNAVLPLLSGRARKEVAAEFNEIVLLDIRKGERVFATGEARWQGVACRGLQGPHVFAADTRELIKRIVEANKPQHSKPKPPPPQLRTPSTPTRNVNSNSRNVPTQPRR